MQVLGYIRRARESTNETLTKNTFARVAQVIDDDLVDIDDFDAYIDDKSRHHEVVMITAKIDSSLNVRVHGATCPR